MHKLSIVLFSIALLSGCRSPHSYKSPIKDREYLIDQPIGQLESLLETIRTGEPLGYGQQPLNYTCANLSFLYEIKLHFLFEEYLGSLPETERRAAQATQIKWVKGHKKKVANAAAEYEGGTFAGFAAGLAAVDSYKARIAEIEERMNLKADP